ICSRLCVSKVNCKILLLRQRIIARGLLRSCRSDLPGLPAGKNKQCVSTPCLTATYKRKGRSDASGCANIVHNTWSNAQRSYSMPCAAAGREHRLVYLYWVREPVRKCPWPSVLVPPTRLYWPALILDPCSLVGTNY